MWKHDAWQSCCLTPSMNQLSRCVYLAHRDNLTTVESGECRWKLGKMSIRNETLRTVYARAVCRRSAIVRLNKDGHDHNPPIPSCMGTCVCFRTQLPIPLHPPAVLLLFPSVKIKSLLMTFYVRHVREAALRYLHINDVPQYQSWSQELFGHIGEP